MRVDWKSPAGAFASLADGIAAVEGVGSFRAASPLPLNAQILIDQAVSQVGLDRLVIVQDLINRGLTFDIPDWWGTPSIYSQRVGRAGNAIRSMVPETRGERQVPSREGWQIPVFCTTDDFSFNRRELAVAARSGVNYDTTSVELATRNVNEKIEEQAIYGWADENNDLFTVDGNSAPGFLNDPINYRQYSGGTALDDNSVDGADVFNELKAMIAVLQAQRFFGPYVWYVPTTYAQKFGEDYKANSDLTIAQRLVNANDLGGGARVSIVAADLLPANASILLQPTREVVDVCIGQTPTTVNWTDGPAWRRFFVVLACVIVRIKRNIDNKQGFVVGGTAAP